MLLLLLLLLLLLRHLRARALRNAIGRRKKRPSEHAPIPKLDLQKGAISGQGQRRNI